MGILQDELSQACPCNLKFDSFELSLLRLRATGSNVRIERDGTPHLRFRELEAKFSLSDILQRRIILSELNLKDGFSQGVGPDSSTFQFIDQLTAPAPPEKDFPDRLKVQLERIVVSNAEFVEPIRTTQVLGRNVDVVVQRTPEGDFTITPSIGALALDFNHTKVLNLGSVGGEVFLDDNSFFLKRVRLSNGNANLIIDAEVLQQDGNPLSGEADFLLDDAAVGISRLASFLLYGSGPVSGRLKYPELSGSFSNPTEQPTIFRYESDRQLEFAKMGGDFTLSWEEKEPIFTLQHIEASNSLGQFSLSRPFRVSTETLEGEGSFSLDSFEFSSVTLKEMRAEIVVDSSWTKPKLTARIQAPQSFFGEFPLGAFNAILELDGRVLSFKADTEFSFAQKDAAPLHPVAQSSAAQPSITPHSSDKTLETTTTGSLEFSGDDWEQIELKPTEILVRAGPQKRNASSTFPILDASFRIQGPLDPRLVTGSGNFRISSTNTLVDGKVEIKDGTAAFESSPTSKKIALSAAIGLTEDIPSLLELRLTDFNALEFTTPRAAGTESTTPYAAPTSNKQCSSITGSLRYRFLTALPKEGSGELDVQKLSIGCAPVSIALVGPFVAPIDAGGFKLRKVAFAGTNSSLTVDGEIDPGMTLDLGLNGSLDLRAIAPLIRSVDDIRGQVTLDSFVKGPFEDPTLSGHIAIEDGELDSASSDVSLRAVTGQCSITDGGLEFENVSGRLNEGVFELSGRLEPLAIEESVATLTFRDLLLTPTDELSVILSGSLGIAPDSEGTAAISGEITIDSAEFRKSLNLAQLLRQSALSLVKPSNALKSIPSRTALPDIPLDLKLVAPGNIFIDTPWAAGELKANFQIRGTIETPVPTGSVEVLAGWIGLRDRRFEITNGRAELKSSSLDPSIDLLAETTIRTREGDILLVFLEASGVASAPRLRLTSDRGLSEAEILSLFTTRTGVGTASTASSVTSGFELDALEFIEDYSFLGLGRLVRGLARIDSLSIEPTFSPQRGTVEPTLVATKRLFDHLSLVGQTLFGSTSNDSSLRLVYDVSPAVEISGILDAATQDRGSSAGVDLSYTLLGERRRFLDIRTSGNNIIRSLDILYALRLNEDTRILPSKVSRLEKRITTFYAKQGFFAARASVECAEVPGFADTFCHQILIEIDEGEPTYIDEVVFDGAALPEFLPASSVKQSVRRSIASEETRKAFEKQLVNALRAEGYLAARVSTSFEPSKTEDVQDPSRGSTSAASRGVTLRAALTVGDPVTFVFTNNTVFSAKEFLETIDLFGRRQPFGSNTVTILLENIERLYNDAGYLFASASVERTKDSAGERVTYHITLEEGLKFQVSQVTFQGLETFSTERLHRALRKHEPEAASLILEPTFAVPDQLEVNTLTITRALELSGFPEAKVTVEVTPDEENKTVEILYTVVEGSEVIADTITIQGAPPHLSLPKVPHGSLSIPAINEIVAELSRTLVDQGYLVSSVSTNFVTEREAVIQVAPGPQSFIEELRIDNEAICAPEVIRQQLLVQAGSKLDQELIQESKRRLLRLGLFARVEMILEPLDSEAIAHRLVVSVQERSLRTVTIGGGANSELGLHIFGEATDRKLFGDGRSLTARIDTYYDRVAAEISQGIASLTYGDPVLLGSDYSYYSDLRYQREALDNQEFDLDRVALANYAHRSRSSESDLAGLSWSIGHTILQEDLTNVSPGAIIGSFDTGLVRLGFLSALINFDGRDDPLNPTRGFSVQGESIIAAQALGSEAEYLAFQSKASYLTPLGFLSPRWSFASGSRFGVAWKLADTDEIPISQRFYLGGRTTVRGFKDNSLGPLGFDGAVQGGDLTASQNLELRHRLASNTEVLSFFDFGGLFLQDDPILLKDVRESFGLGVRYLSPIGPIGFDLGFPLDRRSGESTYQVHFNIGSNF